MCALPARQRQRAARAERHAYGARYASAATLFDAALRGGSYAMRALRDGARAKERKPARCARCGARAPFARARAPACARHAIMRAARKTKHAPRALPPLFSAPANARAALFLLRLHAFYCVILRAGDARAFLFQQRQRRAARPTPYSARHAAVVGFVYALFCFVLRAFCLFNVIAFFIIHARAGDVIVAAGVRNARVRCERCAWRALPRAARAFTLHVTCSFLSE